MQAVRQAFKVNRNYKIKLENVDSWQMYVRVLIVVDLMNLFVYFWLFEFDGKLNIQYKCYCAVHVTFVVANSLVSLHFVLAIVHFFQGNIRQQKQEKVGKAARPRTRRRVQFVQFLYKRVSIPVEKLISLKTRRNKVKMIDFAQTTLQHLDGSCFHQLRNNLSY